MFEVFSQHVICILLPVSVGSAVVLSVWYTHQFPRHLELLVDHFLSGDDQSHGAPHGGIPQQGHDVSLGLPRQILPINLHTPKAGLLNFRFIMKIKVK